MSQREGEIDITDSKVRTLLVYGATGKTGHLVLIQLASDKVRIWERRALHLIPKREQPQRSRMRSR